MPDGNVITIGAERWRCIEPLFEPWLLDLESAGLGQMLFDAISTCDTEIQMKMVDNVVLGGGTTMLRNFDKRLEEEVQTICLRLGADKPKWYMNMCQQAIRRIHVDEDRTYSAWCGGSVLCTWSASESRSTEKEWITSDEYEECGQSIIHRKRYQW